MDPAVLEVMLPFLTQRYGNPSSIHRFGGMVRRSIDGAREQVAALLDCYPDEIIFTGSGSEGDNAALKGFACLQGTGARFVTSVVEHPAVLASCSWLEQQGHTVAMAGVNAEGELDEDAVCTAAGPGTMVSLMWANNETGVLFPIDRIAHRVKEAGGMMHTDAVQAVGKVPLSLRDTPVDLLVLSGHKLHAPKGVGALFVRRGVKLPPLLHGGHQEGGGRAGTENVAGIVALGKACERALECRDQEEHIVGELRDCLEQAVLERCRGARRNGSMHNRLPNTTNISFEFIEGEGILLLLDEHGIAASSGSACTTGSLEPSHVMRAMGIPYTLAHSSIRFSLSRYTTRQEIDTVIEVLPPIIDRLRALSPYVQEGT